MMLQLSLLRSSALCLREFFIGLQADVVRLDPVVDLISDLVFECLAFHRLFVHEELLNEDLSEALLQLVICVPHGRSVLAEVNLGAAHRSAILTRRLVAMPYVQPEHKLV